MRIGSAIARAGPPTLASGASPKSDHGAVRCFGATAGRTSPTSSCRLPSTTRRPTSPTSFRSRPGKDGLLQHHRVVAAAELDERVRLAADRVAVDGQSVDLRAVGAGCGHEDARDVQASAEDADVPQLDTGRAAHGGADLERISVVGGAPGPGAGARDHLAVRADDLRDRRRRAECGARPHDRDDNAD